MKTKEYRFKSANGINSIFGVAYIPDGTFKGYIQFLHDQFEHISRYENIMKRFCEKGYLVFGHDHMCHGRSAESCNELGKFSGENNHINLIEDAENMFYQVVGDYQPAFQKQEIMVGENAKPYETIRPTLRCIIGIGLGAAVARAYVIRKKDCNAVVFCGDRGFPAALLNELRICRNEIKKLGPDGISEKLKNAIMGNYNQYFDGENKNRWRMESISGIRKYESDPLCRFEYDLKSWSAMLQLQTMYRQKDWIMIYPKYLATYFISGYLDPVSRYTKELDSVLDRFRYSNKVNVFFNYYEKSRHDLFFDESKDRVFNDVLRFVNGVLQQQC